MTLSTWFEHTSSSPLQPLAHRMSFCSELEGLMRNKAGGVGLNLCPPWRSAYSKPGHSKEALGGEK